MKMPSSAPSSRRWSTLLLLVSFFVTALHHLPTVCAQFNEADCLSCVESVSTDDFFNATKTYCEVGEIGSGNYQCVSDLSSLCTDNENTTYSYEWSCDPDLLAGAAAAFLGLAFGLAICFYCCIGVVVLAIVGGIVACVVLCVRRSNRPPQQQYAGAPQLVVLPGTLATSTNKTTTILIPNAAVLPAQTGLAGGMNSPYHQPSYQSSYDDNNNNSNNNINNNNEKA
jgi:hypothetical protein